MQVGGGGDGFAGLVGVGGELAGAQRDAHVRGPLLAGEAQGDRI